MDKFVYQYPVRQYFGKGCAESAIKEEMKCAGQPTHKIRHLQKHLP